VLEASPDEPFCTLKQKIQDLEGKAVPEAKDGSGIRCLFLSQPLVVVFTQQHLNGGGKAMRNTKVFTNQFNLENVKKGGAYDENRSVIIRQRPMFYS